MLRQRSTKGVGKGNAPDSDKKPLAKTVFEERKTDVGGESKLKKVLVRTVVGGLIVILFNCIIWAGHVYTVCWVFLLQLGCFSELNRVGLDEGMERRLPRFRQLQWLWFFAATLCCYGDWLEDTSGLLAAASPLTASSGVSPLQTMHSLLRFQPLLSLGAFSVAFVLSILGLKQGCYLYQIRQLAFTLASLLLVFGQMKLAMHSIYTGLFWYFVPSSIVVTNDIMACA